MNINASSFPKFGNMIFGGGLTAIFDSSNTTVGYTQNTLGWAGVSLDSPRRIDKIELTSFSNGFDSSGLNSNITLKLMGKAGSTPVSYDDGICLGSISFVDSNTTQLVTINSSNKISKYDCIWCVILCGVWATLVDFKIYEATDPIPMDAVSDKKTIFIKSCNDSVPLTRYGLELIQHRITFKLSTPRVVQIDYHADVIHTGDGADSNIAVGYGFSILRRQSDTEDGITNAPIIFIKNALGGGNISERNPQHYGNKTICSAINLSAGFHQISVFASGHTDGSDTVGILKMLVEGGYGVNALRVSIEQIETILYQ